MANVAVFPAPEPRSLGERAYQRLVKMITRLDLAPGQIINERQLIEELGIGRTPIREALHRLVGEGLVVHHRNRGMFVADLNATTVKHIYEFRALVELEAARLAALRAGNGDIAELRDIAQRMREAASAGAIDLYVELDRAFYVSLAQAAENEFLRDVIPRTFNHHLRVWFFIASRSGGWNEIIGAHMKMVATVVEGIADRDPERAVDALSTYITERHRDATTAK
ncbi:MAG: FCD domain-containing protein [Rhizobiales bacterium]|nr:FCD domain-containing protein [Hyphomicrobiales bacterium]